LLSERIKAALGDFHGRLVARHRGRRDLVRVRRLVRRHQAAGRQWACSAASGEGRGHEQRDEGASWVHRYLLDPSGAGVAGAAAWVGGGASDPRIGPIILSNASIVGAPSSFLPL